MWWPASLSEPNYLLLLICVPLRLISESPCCQHEKSIRPVIKCILSCFLKTGLGNNGQVFIIEPRFKSAHQLVISKKKVREKSRECHNHKPQPFPDPKRKRKPTNPNKHKSNKRTKRTLSSPSEVIAILIGLKNTRTK